MKTIITKKIMVFLFATVLSGCSLAPAYHRPAMNIPANYKETGHWLRTTPGSANFERGPWWEMYSDPTLNELEPQVEDANQNLKAAIARYDEARAAAKVARAAYFPTVDGSVNASRAHSSGNIANKLGVPLYNDYSAGIDFSYELDVWGKVRNRVAAAKSLEYASVADLAVINLSLHAELALDYFTLRGYDASQRVLDKTVLAYQKALYLTEQRHNGGIVSIEDVYQAENQVETAKTAAADTRLKRSQLEHAIALLIGKAPASFTLKAALPETKIVTLAPMLPSTLLERRPDIIEAEQYVQAANANIGVARAAYFPDFNLSGGIGYESSSLANLFRGPSLVWALGPAAVSSIVNQGLPLASETIFDGGRISGLSDEAYAKYEETAANYRQTVLAAYQEVEDNLVAIHQLDQERVTQTKATVASERALKQAQYLYKGGLTTFLDVVVVENIALQNELASINVNTRRQNASVQLIKALGGGWHESA